MSYQKMDLAVEREKMEISNMEGAQKVLYNKLPEIASNLNINEINLGASDIKKLISTFVKAED